MYIKVYMTMHSHEPKKVHVTAHEPAKSCIYIYKIYIYIYKNILHTNYVYMIAHEPAKSYIP